MAIHESSLYVAERQNLVEIDLDAGEIVEIMDTLGDGFNCADFEFIDEFDLLIVPTFLGNRVAAYMVKGG